LSLIIYPSPVFVINCHVVIFAETMDPRDLAQEELLGDMIRNNGPDVILAFLNDTDGLLEGEDDEASGDRRMEEDVSGDRMLVEEGRDDHGSDDRTTEEGSAVAKSGEVYIYIYIH
jgi:hypothetical protein